MACAKKDHDNVDPPPVVQSLVNYAHLDYLFTPVQFETGIHAAGIYIYSESPDYRLVADDDEGFTSVDDVARAALVYMRSDSFNVIEDTRNKVFMLLSFLLEMQAANGYFYNFLLPGDLINKYHANSVAGMNWWSWRAFQALAEAAPLIGDHNPSLAIRINSSLEKITSGIKSDLAGQTQTTKEVSGLTVPQWLPQGSASDQAATLLLALVNYCSLNNDVILEQYISSLAEGVSMMQQGDADHFPYGCFLSWENQWHAYGNEQAYALLKAAVFLSNNSYLDKALLEISNFYPWLINNDYRSDMLFKKVNDEVSIVSEKTVRPDCIWNNANGARRS